MAGGHALEDGRQLDPETLRDLSMKKFLLGVIVGVILICAGGFVYELRREPKARDLAVKAETAARVAADAAVRQAPIR